MRWASAPFKNWVKCSSPLPAFIIAEGIGLMGKGVGIGGASVSVDQHRGIGHNVQHGRIGGKTATLRGK